MLPRNPNPGLPRQGIETRRALITLPLPYQAGGPGGNPIMLADTDTCGLLSRYQTTALNLLLSILSYKINPDIPSVSLAGPSPGASCDHIFH